MMSDLKFMKTDEIKKNHKIQARKKLEIDKRHEFIIFTTNFLT